MNGCPISCPCRRGGDGAFLIAACVFAALHSWVFLGGDFGAMVTGLLHQPHDLPLSLAIWASVAAAGLWLLVIGIRALVREGDTPPALPSLAKIAAGAAALGWGWYLPPTWGAVWSLGSEGFCFAMIAAGAANLCLALGSQVWMAGYVAAGGDHTRPRAVPFDPDKWRLILDRQEKELAAAAAENNEMKAVLAFPGVRPALLHALHSDHHAGASESERRIRDETFIKLTAIYQRIGAKQ
jgi:hypothetical protein